MHASSIIYTFEVVTVSAHGLLYSCMGLKVDARGSVLVKRHGRKCW